MNDTYPDIPPEDRGASEPGPAPESRPPAGEPRRRSLLWGLIAVYAASLLAAGVLLWRAKTRVADAKPEPAAPSAGLLAGLGKKDAVALVSIDGPIYASDGGSVFDRGAQQWARRIEKLAEKSEVKAIVLAINSPGGSVGAVQEVYGAIERARRDHKKPVVAHLGDVAASGGYYLAAACDKVVAHPGTLLGSIGVIFFSSNVQELLGKIGVQARVIKSGKMKDIGSAVRPMTEEERRLLQELIDNAYGQFFRAVAHGRRMPEERLRPLADGRIFTGEQSLENGLVDQLGDTKAAIRLAAQLGGIKDPDPRVIRDADSLSSVLLLLESRLSALSGPGLSVLRSLPGFGRQGLEYRWVP